MNFFNRNSAPTPDSPTSPPPSEPPLSSPPVSMDTPTAPSTNPSSTPPSSDPPKKFRFPRFRNPLAGRNNQSSDNSHDNSVPNTDIKTPTPEQLARRAARRAERQRLHDEWVEKNHERRKQAVLQNRPYEPLPEPPHINSDSEHDDNEEEEPEAVAMPPPTQLPHFDGPQPVGISNAEERPQHASTESGVDPGPYLPPRPEVYEGNQEGAHMATPAGAHMATPAATHMAIPAGAQGAAGQGGAGMPMPTGPPRDLMAEARMADMFGREAFTGVKGVAGQEKGAMAGYSGMSKGGEMGQMYGRGDGVGRGAPQGPAQVGWGDAYGSVPSHHMQRNPMMGHNNPAVDIDYTLSEKIRRGRELGRLAVSQEEQGNLGAAESGYMKALELLIPATRELEVGNELSKNARMTMKMKVQREAAAMLDRVEELKVFLKANGPAVPNEIPVVPGAAPSQPRGRGNQGGGWSDGGGRATGGGIPEDLPPDLAKLSIGGPPKVSEQGAKKAAQNLPPPPPPPPFFDGDESHNFATTTESPTSVPPPQTPASYPSPVSPMGTTATPSTDRPETPPPSGEHPKKFRFPRFRKPLSTKSNPPSDKSPDTSTATHVPILTPEKITRRVARRAERQRLHDEWVEKNHQLRKEAVAQNRPFEPLPEPPHINSDSEHDDHEDEEPEAVVMPSPTEKPQATEIGYVEERLQNDSGENGIEGGTLLPARSDGAQVAASQGADEMPVPAGPPRDLMAEAKMAEMFGREAYTGLREDVGSGNGTVNGYAGANGEEEDGQITGEGEAVGRRVLRGPTHVGWGDAYGSVPSQPMYGNPVVGYANPALDIDYVLSEKIRRGRELGRLAVSQEEQGNLGAAESGYMKALELLIPATRELEVGSELTKSARMGVKRKVQREAASMLDRVEEIKVFLKANGPAVPNVLPVIPAMVPSHPKGRGSQYGGQSDGGESPGESRARRRVKRELDKQKENSASPELGAQSMVHSKKKSSIGKAPNKPPPPPPPPFFGDNESGDFLQRITNRKNVVSDASAGFHSVGVPRIISKPSSKSTRAGKANCFMCNAPATLVAPCDHAFCSSCGRQACSVFENCPVPGCNKPLSMETFSEIQ